MQVDPAPDANQTVTEPAFLLPHIIMFTNASTSGAFFMCASPLKECGEYHV